MKLAFLPRLFVFAAPLVACLTGCIPLPKLPKVSLPKVDIPFIGGEKTPAVNDPSVPYAVSQTLGYGHTLDLAVYAGMLSPKQIFKAKVMVDEQGSLDLRDFGKVRVGGMKAYDALKQIQTAFLKKRGEAVINVHLSHIEEVPLVTVVGAVKQPGVVQWFDDANVASLLPYTGGRSGTAKGEAVYVTRSGTRNFHATLTGASFRTLAPGDIVTFSDDL